MTANSSSGGRRQAHRAFRLRFREWAALLLSFCVIGMIGALAFSHVSSDLFSHVFSESPIAGAKPRTAAVLVETEPGQCRQFTFDNESGKIVPAGASCDPQVVREAHPTGTMGRIDAISKSFSGK